MVKTYRGGKSNKENIEADVIILGCSLPGIVTAHKLKSKFGDAMDIVVLDLGRSRYMSKCNVAFQEQRDDEDPIPTEHRFDGAAKEVIDSVARHYLVKYTREFNIPIPESIISTQPIPTSLHKLFQYTNGNTVQCTKDYHDFDYLNIVEKFELNQYQTLLDQSIGDLFQVNKEDTEAERKKLLYYDQTTMEKHICDALFFPTSREIMRMTVRLVCGSPADTVSVLFYLHQCYRTNSSRNHLDGDNTRFREKLLGYCRKRLAHKLQQSIADITLPAKSITEIRTYSREQVILETMKGENNYVCNLLAMALRPDELRHIRVETQLLSEREVTVAQAMKPGRAKKFLVQYEENFWRSNGYSGDILSIRGPIIWAMERPKMSTTGSLEKYSSLVGYLLIRDDDILYDSQAAVVDQLVKLFGPKAASPVNYTETDVADIFVPRCGDYVALRKWTEVGSPRHLEWGALDIFADGDVAAALEAGHRAYVHLLSCLRPQAQTFEDISASEWPTRLCDDPLKRWLAYMNYMRTLRFATYTALVYIGVRLLRAFMRK